jgi:uncharacterized protein YndB with AHSA1/START domain
MGEIRIVHEYPYSPAMLWRAVTDPELVARWTVSGRGGRPVGFEASLGNRFQFVGKPVPGWRGIVYCEVVEVDEPFLLRYSWRDDELGVATVVTYRLEPLADGTRFTFEHTGFTGIEGFFMSKLLKFVRNKMLRIGLPRVLAELNETVNRGDPA